MDLEDYKPGGKFSDQPAPPPELEDVKEPAPAVATFEAAPASGGVELERARDDCFHPRRTHTTSEEKPDYGVLLPVRGHRVSRRLRTGPAQFHASNDVERVPPLAGRGGLAGSAP